MFLVNAVTATGYIVYVYTTKSYIVCVNTTFHVWICSTLFHVPHTTKFLFYYKIPFFFLYFYFIIPVTSCTYSPSLNKYIPCKCEDLGVSIDISSGFFSGYYKSVRYDHLLK